VPKESIKDFAKAENRSVVLPRQIGDLKELRPGRGDAYAVVFLAYSKRPPTRHGT